jgi:hypothetical protein
MMVFISWRKSGMMNKLRHRRALLEQERESIVGMMDRGEYRPSLHWMEQRIDEIDQELQNIEWELRQAKE